MQDSEIKRLEHVLIANKLTHSSARNVEREPSSFDANICLERPMLLIRDTYDCGQDTVFFPKMFSTNLYQ